MFSKVVAVALLAVAVQAQYGGHGGYAQPSYGGHGGYGHEDYSAPAYYSFHYAVNDPHTYDIKSHHETRNGDKTEGEYRLVEPDGSTRIVKYTVDGKYGGFNAQVLKEGGKSYGYSAPSYSAPSYGHAAPSYSAPSYSHGSSYGSQVASYKAAPSYGYAAPSYGHAAPAYKAAPSYGHGGATSSSSISTHGAKVYTSTHHVAPAPKSYY